MNIQRFTDQLNLATLNATDTQYGIWQKDLNKAEQNSNEIVIIKLSSLTFGHANIHRCSNTATQSKNDKWSKWLKHLFIVLAQSN